MAILDPSDFGKFVFPLIIINLVFALVHLGFLPLLIKETLTHKQIQSITWTSFLLGLGLMGLLNAVCFVFSNLSFFKYLQLLSFSIPFYVYYSISLSLYRKEFKFKHLFFYNLTSVLIAGLVSVFLAYEMKDAVALVVKFNLYYIILCVFTFGNIKSFIFQSIDFSPARKLFSYSSPILGNQLISFFSRNIDDWIIGSLLGDKSLGLYNRSYKLLIFPLAQIGSTYNNFSLPFLSKQKDVNSKGGAFLKSSRIISLFFFPLFALLFLISETLVVSLLGGSWIEAIPLIKIFSVLGFSQCIGVIMENFFISVDASKQAYKFNLISQTIIIVSLVVVTIMYRNLLLTALTYCIFSILKIFPYFYLLGRNLNLSLPKILLNLTPNLVASITPLLLLHLITKYQSFNIITLVLLYSVIYLICILLQKKSLSEAKNLIEELFRT